MKTSVESAPWKSGAASGFGVLGARLIWGLFGLLALLGIACGIVSHGTGWPAGLDAALGIVVVWMLLGRWVECRAGTATMATHEPVTLERHITLRPPPTVLVWIVTRVAGQYVS
jgi:hypothetical protein